jgi:hypothetical protein
MTTGNGHDRTGGLAPPVPRPKDPTGALRQRRARARRRDRDATTALAGNQNFEKANDFKGSVTVATVTDKRANQSKTVTPFAQSQWQAGGSPVTVPERHPGAAAYAGAVMLASAGVTLSAVGISRPRHTRSPSAASCSALSPCPRTRSRLPCRA